VPIIASFGELDGLDAIIPWLGLTALSLVLGVVGIVAGGRFKARPRVAVGLGAAACLLELAGVARVLGDPWWRRRFERH
jgi:hypothetical protein